MRKTFTHTYPSIDDYRGIMHLVLDGFHPQMNLLVGANGAGKTMVLDAMVGGIWLMILFVFGDKAIFAFLPIFLWQIF